MSLTISRYGAIAVFGLILATSTPLHAQTTDEGLSAGGAAEFSGELSGFETLSPTSDDALLPADDNAVASEGFLAEEGLLPLQSESGLASTPAVTEAEQVLENPYGFKAAWATADWVNKSTFIVLGIMSAATWYILFFKLLEQNRLLKQSREVNRRFWDKNSVQEGLDDTEKGTPFWYVAERGLKSSRHHRGQVSNEVDRSTWIILSLNRAVDEIQSHLQKGLAVLATVGSTAPFVGLFGTVWGIYHALTAIGISGQASIDKVAGPVGEALIMTALGLAVAVPAVLGYNWLVRRNKAAIESVRSFASDLHSVLLAGSRVGEEDTAAAPVKSIPSNAQSDTDDDVAPTEARSASWA